MMNDKRRVFLESKVYRIAADLFYALQFPRAILHIYLFLTSSVRSVIEKDIERWLEIEYPERLEKKRPAWVELVWLLWKFQEYRNLFYYRIKREFRILSRVILEIASLFYSPLPLLYIRADFIDEGFYIQHGYGTSMTAKHIGKNCWVNQHVVIGFLDTGKYPTIGDNVHIGAGAKILGDITVGSNSNIGANAVVIKDVPPNCTVVGVPAYIVKRDGKRVKKI